MNQTKKERSAPVRNETVPGNDDFHDLLLKVTPPRVPRYLVSRTRLLRESPALQDYTAVLVQAPAGFGKTSLLAQWRREYLHLGVVVAWVSAQAADSPRRLAQSLAFAVRVAAARPHFGRGLLEAGAPGGIQNITDFLVELAGSEKPVVSGVDGLAIGIGTTLNMHCDLTVASARSLFKTPFAELGLVPEAGSSLLGPRAMGHQRAFGLLVIGEGMNGEAAREAQQDSTVDGVCRRRLAPDECGTGYDRAHDPLGEPHETSYLSQVETEF